MKALLINLKCSSERLEFQKKQLDSLNINYEIVEAIETSQIDENFYQLNSMAWERPLRKSELACCLSHTIAWNKVVEDNKPYLILEDDALLNSDTFTALNTLGNYTNYDCINFETRNRKKIISKTKIKVFKNYTLSKIIHNKSGAAAYLLWPSGAKILLNYYTKHGAALADSIIANCDRFKHFQIEPALAIQIDCCDHYNIAPPLITASNISEQPKPTTNKIFIFIYRRFKSQFKILLKQLSTIPFARNINVPFYGDPTEHE